MIAAAVIEAYRVLEQGGDQLLPVLDTVARLKSVGLNPTEEFNTDCCYALQDKAWVRDPDDHHWEIFVVHVDDTAPELNIDSTAKVPQSEEVTTDRSCCAPICCA